jgi:hypothetical protein
MSTWDDRRRKEPNEVALWFQILVIRGGLCSDYSFLTPYSIADRRFWRKMQAPSSDYTVIQHNISPETGASSSSRDSVVGIATDYGLGDRGVGVRVPAVSMSSTPALGPTQPHIQWVPGGLFPRGKAAGAWSWPLTSNECRGKENVDLYIHSPHTPSWRSA